MVRVGCTYVNSVYILICVDLIIRPIRFYCLVAVHKVIDKLLRLRNASGAYSSYFMHHIIGTTRGRINKQIRNNLFCNPTRRYDAPAKCEKCHNSYKSWC